MRTDNILEASDGMIYTDWKETHGVIIDLGEDRSKDEFSLVTLEEFDKFEKKKRREQKWS